MKKNYAETAANWWCTTIEDYNSWIEPSELDIFRTVLSNKIKNTISKNAHIEFSSCRNLKYHPKIEFINNIASSVSLNAKIPEGYDMTIFSDTGISVYNNSGCLLASF